MPKALARQFEQAPALFEVFGWSATDHPEFEADDLLGSLSKLSPLSSLSSVAVGTSSAQVCTVAFYIVRSLRAAASTHFTLMGRNGSRWQEAATAAAELEARFVQAALLES